MPLLAGGHSPTWPEVLRLAVTHWTAQAATHAYAEAPESALQQLADHLGHSAYGAASPSLKARALHA
eukprot:3491624-Prymnesium_polylepis.1